MLSTLLRRVYNTLFMLLAVVLILAALMLTASRLLLPYASEYRETLEIELGNAFQRPVSIDSLGAEMRGFTPVLTLNYVVLHDKSGDTPLLNFRQINVGLSLLGTLRNMKPILSRFEIVGAEISIIRNKSGQFRLSEFSLPDNQDVKVKQDYFSLLEPLFEQRNISILNFKIVLLDEIKQTSLSLDDVNIRLKNRNERHQLDVDFLLPPVMGERVKMAIDFKGAIRQWRQSRINLYLSSGNLYLPELMSQFLKKDDWLFKGSVNSELWLTFDGDRLSRGQGSLQFSDLVSAKARRSEIENARLDFVLAQEEAGWMFDIWNARLSYHNREHTPFRVMVRSSTHDLSKADWTVKASQLNLNDARHLSSFFSVVKSKYLLGFIEKEGFAGQLRDVRLTYLPHASLAERFSLQARFEDVTLPPFRKQPGIGHMSGVVWTNLREGSFLLDSASSEIRVVAMFREPLYFSRLQGYVHWRILDNAWHVYSTDLYMQNHDARSRVGFHLSKVADMRPQILMTGTIREGKGASIPKYLPVSLMSEPLIQWMDKAFVKGSVEQADIVYRGEIGKGTFPVNHKRSYFEADMAVRQLNLHYQDGWPNLTNTDAHLRFDGPGMMSEAQGAVLDSVALKRLEVRIRNFKRAKVEIKGEAKSDLSNGLAFIMHSPLKDSLGVVTKRVQGSGDVALKMDMSIPLSGHNKSVRYQGELALRDCRLYSDLEWIKLNADALNGDLFFTQSRYRSNRIKANVFERPAIIRVSSHVEDKTNVIELEAKGEVSSQALKPLTEDIWFHQLRGKTAWNSQVRIYQPPSSPSRSEISVTTDLNGMAMTLPYPVAKKADSRQPFKAVWQTDQQQLRLDLGESMHAALGFVDQGGSSHLRKIAVHFGEQSPSLPVDEIMKVTGSLDRFPVSEWIDSFSEEGEGKDSSDPIFDWPVEVNMQRLHVETPESDIAKAVEITRFDPARLPVLNAEVTAFSYNEYLKLGQLNFRGKPRRGAYEFSELKLKSPVKRFSATGSWHGAPLYETRLKINLQSGDTGGLISVLNLEPPIEGGKLNLFGELSWPGAPGDFNFSSLHGKSSFNVEDGKFVDIEPGAGGRFFGLFSFQALPRRLMLDFSDLFGSGYRFDNLEGEVDIGKGDVTTNNLIISAPAANVAITGRTGLVKEDYDQKVLVIPKGSNLAVLGWLAWGPQTGAMVWLAERLFNFERVASFSYHITGTWDEPIVTRLTEEKN